MSNDAVTAGTRVISTDLCDWLETIAQEAQACIEGLRENGFRDLAFAVSQPRPAELARQGEDAVAVVLSRWRWEHLATAIDPEVCGHFCDGCAEMSEIIRRQLDAQRGGEG